MRVGHDQHRLARPQALCRRPHPALVHHQRRLRKQRRKRRILRHANRFRQRLPRPVPLIRPNQQHRPHSQPHRRLGAELVEPSRRQHRRRPQRKHHRRRPRRQKLLEICRQLVVPRVRIVVAEPRNPSVFRPVLLLHSQHPRKQRQHQVGRMLGVEQRIRTLRQSQLRPQIVDRLRPLPAHKPRQPPDRPAHPRNCLVRPRQPRIHGQNRRVERRKERQRRQHVTRPGNPRHLGHQRPRVVQLAQQQQVGPLRPRSGVQQIVVGLAQYRKQELPQPPLRALLHVVDHLHQDRVLGVDIRPHRVKLEAQRHNLLLKHRRHRHHRRVSSPLQLQRHRDQRIDVPKRPDIRQNNTQNRLPELFLPRSYEGNPSDLGNTRLASYSSLLISPRPGPVFEARESPTAFPPPPAHAILKAS